MKLVIAYTEYLSHLKLLKLNQISGNHTELISCYISAEKNLVDVINKLRTQKQESANIKDKVNKKRVLSAIDHAIVELTRYIGQTLKSGLAVFTTPDSSFSIIPPFINRLNYYRCDSAFYLTPLLSGGQFASVSYGLLALDSDQATFAELRDGAVVYLNEVDSNVSRSVKKGGQSQRRYAFARVQALLHYYNTVADLCNQYWQKKEIKKIYYGGILPESERFIKRNTCLLDSVSKKFSECYPLQYCDRLGIKNLVQLAESDMESTAYSEHVNFFEKLLEVLDAKKTTTDLKCVKHVICTTQYLKNKLEETDDPLNLADTDIAVSILEQGSPSYAHVALNYSGLIYLTTAELAT